VNPSPPPPRIYRALQCVRDARSKFVAGVGTSYGEGFGFRMVCNDGAQRTYFVGDTEGQGIEVRVQRMRMRMGRGKAHGHGHEHAGCTGGGSSSG
jgi:hypothetical protein